MNAKRTSLLMFDTSMQRAFEFEFFSNLGEDRGQGRGLHCYIC